MGNPTGELAHGFDLQHLPQLLLQGSPLGDILGDEFELPDDALLIGQSSAIQANGDDSAVPTAPRYLVFNSLFLQPFLEQRRAVFSTYMNLGCGVQLQHVTSRVIAQHRDQGGVYFQELAIQPDAINAMNRSFEKCPVAFFGRTQRLFLSAQLLFCQFSICNVAAHSRSTNAFSGAVLDG